MMPYGRSGRRLPGDGYPGGDVRVCAKR